MKQPESGSQHDLIQHRFLIAQEDLETAHLLLDAKQYRGANNRAYYSIYHTIDAILSIESIAFKRHKDTLAYFNKHYIATEIFPRNMGRKIVKAEEIRHASDYDTFSSSGDKARNSCLAFSRSHQKCNLLPFMSKQ